MVENPDGIVTEYAYNENGLMMKSYQYHKNDPSSKRYVEIARDNYGRETEVMDARGEVKGEMLSQKYTYEWGNNLVKSVESAGGIKTHYGYSHVDDTLIGITTDDNGIEHTNRMSYTANLLTGLDNMSGIRYNYKYDGFGRMTEATINGTSHVTFDYGKETVDGKTCDKEVMTLASGDKFTTLNEVDGNYFEIKHEDANKVETVIKRFNEFNKTERYKQYTEFPNRTNQKVHTLHYDENGNLEKHVFGNHSAEYEYDKYNRTTKTDYCFSTSDKHAYTYKYKDGLKNELEEIKGFGLTQTFGHDKLGRQTESKISDSCCTSIYSKKATYLKYGDHTTDIIADLTYRIANGNTDREKYSYDKEGNISAIHENGKLKVRYTYDVLNRLIREDNKELELTTTFEYDNGGNLIRQNEYAYSLAPTDELTDGTEIVYTYAESRSDMLTDFNGEAIAYDANGCPETYRDNACTFTRATLLKSYGSNNFEYDADGVRTKKNGITFTYVDGKLIRQTGGSGTIDFIYGAGGAIGFKFNNATYIYRRNLMGDVTHIYTTDGTLVARYVYDAWGNHNITTDIGGIGTLNPIRYRGYYYDTETELYYLEARYYDPETGRFISQDEIDFIIPNHLTGLNLYAYCSNNPIMYTDPSGNFFFTALLIGAVAGALIGGAIGGVSAYNNAKALGATGGELIGKTILGAVGGGVIGAAAGAVVGTGAWLAASAITAGIGAIGTGISALSGSGMLAGSLATGGAVISNGAITATGALIAGIAAVGLTFKRIGNSGGYRFDHHYPNDHDPTHVHISGDDGKTRVDINGNPIQNDRPMTPGEKKAFWKIIKEITKALGPWL